MEYLLPCCHKRTARKPSLGLLSFVVNGYVIGVSPFDTSLDIVHAVLVPKDLRIQNNIGVVCLKFF
jgi:hypothetical protein